MGCRGVAVLPAGMSQERFEWLDRWIGEPDDVIRTPGHRVERQGDLRRVRAAATRSQRNVILNQFCEFGNYLGALQRDRAGARARVRLTSAAGDSRTRLAAFVSASGSARHARRG